MKKRKIIISGIIIFILLTALFVPFKKVNYDDGGTTEYMALTYKIVKWNRIIVKINDSGTPVTDIYKKTSVYWFYDKNKSIDELFQGEMDNS